MLKLYKTLTRKVEEFEPLHPPKVGLYTCGMTVYDFAHIGHGRKYVEDDILRRVLTRFGYEVTHVQNVTDVGHLSSDADAGEDKMEKGAAKAGKTVWEVADFFTKHFYSSMDRLNVLRPTIVCKATEHIKEQIALVAKLMAKGYAYDTPEAVYFDVTKFTSYGALSGQKLDEKKTAARGDVKTGEHKKHAADFALWFKRVGRFADHAMHWESPWGDGFPGWHVECSAMSMKYLGDTIDIHTGGIDHIPVHHPNEIAQSEGATGKPFVRFWVHHNFLQVDGKKMSKSLGNYYTVEDVVAKGFDPLALRYFYFGAHYRVEQNFTWEALTNAARSLEELRLQISNLKSQIPKRAALSQEKMEKIDAFRQKFDDAVGNDLNMPQALAVVWEVVKSNIPPGDKYDLLINFDEVLGLNLKEAASVTHKVSSMTSEVEELLVKREAFRAAGKFEEADDVRKQIEEAGYLIEDTPEGPTLRPTS
jgi:cysteinyl-tRNA synthetase